MKKSFYLTTAIDYANGSPHLGHAYEKILSDVIVRFKRLNGQDAHFLTGLDEHGQKVQQGAKKEGISPQMRCNGIAEEFGGADSADVSLSHYYKGASTNYVISGVPTQNIPTSGARELHILTFQSLRKHFSSPLNKTL